MEHEDQVSECGREPRTVCGFIADRIISGEQFIAEHQRNIEQMRLVHAQLQGTELGNADINELGTALYSIFVAGA